MRNVSPYCSLSTHAIDPFVIEFKRLKMKKQIAIVLLSVATAFSGAFPANAFPSSVAPPAVAETSKPVLIRESIGSYLRDNPRILRDRENRDRNWRYNRGDRYDRRYYRDGYYRDRYYRNRDSNAGAIIGGLAAGALIGGALAAPRYSSPRRYVGGDAHTNWCYSRYRTYRASDNTYVPRAGVRAECVSPY